MRAFGDLEIGDYFVPIIDRKTEETVFLFRKSPHGAMYFGGIENNVPLWVEETGAFSDDRPVQPVALEKPDPLLLRLFNA